MQNVRRRCVWIPCKISHSKNVKSLTTEGAALEVVSDPSLEVCKKMLSYLSEGLWEGFLYPKGTILESFWPFPHQHFVILGKWDGEEHASSSDTGL